MAATDYVLATSDWADCGAADDCVLQIPAGSSAVIFTTAASKPASGTVSGLRLSTGTGDHRSATIQKSGLKLWARAIGSPVTVTVER